MVHDQQVTTLKREGHLTGNHLVGEFPGGTGMRRIDVGLGEHLGGEPHEPGIRRPAVQDGERPVLVADVGEIEERSVAVRRISQKRAA